MKSRLYLAQSTLLILCGATIFLPPTALRADVNSPLQQRMDVLAAGQKGVSGLPVLIAAMKNSSAMVRRAAVRSMGDIGTPAESALMDALKNDTDALVRRTALRELIRLNGMDANAALETALMDPSDMVRTAAVQALAGMHPYSPQTTALLKKAQQDASADVSKVASEALWPFHKNGISLRDRPEFKDHQLNVEQTIALPLEGWHFQKDPGQTGQENNWFGTEFNDDNWKTISIGTAWDGQIGGEYDGVAWYRHTLTLPAKPAQAGTDIVFDGVDESAWVWVNGQYVGQHDIGLEGWDKRFAMDASDALKWGQENQITVRVLNRKFAGGIWKPAYLEVLNK